MNYVDLRKLYVEEYKRFPDVKTFNKFIFGLIMHIIFTEFALVTLTSVTIGLWLSVITVILSIYLVLTTIPKGCNNYSLFRVLTTYSKIWVIGILEFVFVIVLIYFLRYV